MASNKNKTIAKNALFLYVRMGIVMLITLFTTRVVLEKLGIEDYGIYNVIFGFVSMFSVLNTTLTAGINRFYNIAIGANDAQGEINVFNVAIRIQTLVSIIVFVIVEVIGAWYVNNIMVLPVQRLPIANYLFQFSVINLMVLILQTPFSALILARERMNFYAFVSVFDAILKLVVVYMLSISSIDSLLLYGLLMLVISLINIILYVSYCRLSFTSVKLSRAFDKPLFKSLMSFSLWSFLDPIAYTIRGQGCNMVLNSFFGPIVNAAYAISNQVASVLDQFAGNFSVAFRPQIIQSYSCGDHERTNRLMTSMSKTNFMLLLMISLPLGLESGYILHLWLGSNVPMYATSFTAFILLVKTINALNAPITTVVQATGDIKRYMLCSSIIVASILPFTWLCLIIGFSPISMYVIMLGLTVVNQIVCIKLLARVFNKFNLMTYLKTVVIPCVSLTFCVSVPLIFVHIFISESFVKLLIMCLCSLIFTAAFALLYYLDTAEKRIALSFINHFISKLKIIK